MASTSQPKKVNRVSPKEPPTKENRDPNNLNDHLKLQFSDVLAEPSSGPQSIDCTWECSEVFFSCCLECWYKLLTLLCGVCIAIYWGLQFVPVLLSNIWIFTPLRQLFWVACGFWCKNVWTLCTRCFLKPCMRSCGLLFINCGDGTIDRSEDPPLFPRKPRRKPEPKQEEPQKDTFVVGGFEDYDKERIKNSVKRTLMLY